MKRYGEVCKRVIAENEKGHSDKLTGKILEGVNFGKIKTRKFDIEELEKA